MSQSEVLQQRSAPRGRFPLARRAGDFVFVSGTSARCRNDSVAGVPVASDNGLVLDIREQTRVVILNLREILQSVDCGLRDLVSVTSYLIRMDDFAAYNGVYGEYFSHDGPTRTTVAVRELSHPHLLIEMQGIAYKPR